MQVQWAVLALEAQWWVTVTMVERSPFLDHPCAICTLHGLLHHFTSKDYVSKSSLWFFNLISLYLKLLSVFLNREQVDLNMMLCPWEKSFPLSARHIFPPLAASGRRRQPNPCMPSTTGETLCNWLSDELYCCKPTTLCLPLFGLQPLPPCARHWSTGKPCKSRTARGVPVALLHLL